MGAADADLLRELPLGGQAVARLQRTGFQQMQDIQGDLAFLGSLGCSF